jgi:hypothetical protein
VQPIDFQPYDRDALRAQFRSAAPFPFIAIDPFLAPDLAAAAAAEIPTFSESQQIGREFDAVNEKNKVQITDSSLFGPAVARVHEALASPEWLEDLSYITGIDHLLADSELRGGGIHVTGPRGRLDVHVDFNFVKDRGLHRRLNILVYLNRDWEKEWGGAIELWDQQVTECAYSAIPSMNRCVIFETSEISYHGVTPVTCPEGVERRSYAAYYYTREAPPTWDGQTHSTVFKARPNERVRGALLMPLERAQRSVKGSIQGAKKGLKRLIDR